MQPRNPAAPPPGSDPVREVLDRLRVGLESKAYDHWIDGKVVLTIESDELTIGVGSPFLLAWMQRQFGVAIRAAAHDVLGPSARVRFIVDARVGLQLPRAKADPTGNGYGENRHSLRQKSDPSPTSEKAVPSPTGHRPGRRYSELAEFVTGSNNEHAYSAAMRFCESPGSFPGVLYLFGGVGLGKTHLLEGIAHRLRSTGSNLRIAFFTAETLANYFTEALRNRTLPAFRSRFRGVDVLIVDDVDFFDGKRGLQEEFLHTLQHLEGRGRSVVLASDRHPKLFTRTSEELITRYAAGTMCRLDSPNHETRLRILQQKAGRLKQPPTAAVLDLIANRFRGSVRELEGALNCLDVYGGIANRTVNVTTARQVLGDLERECFRSIRLPDIERAVCELFGIESDDLRSAKRARSISQPRMLAMYLARKHTNAAYGEIGAHFGGRNHSTVIAAEKKMRKLIETSSTWTVTSEETSLQEVIRSLECRLRAS